MNQLLEDQYERLFRTRPSFLTKAPGRVNLIGEHTDYNEGFVLPMAIDRSVQIALRPRKDQHVVVHSLEFQETVEFDVTRLTKGNGWGEFIKGAAWAMEKEGRFLTGWNGVMTGNVPPGAGLSSSSAVTMAAILAFSSAGGHEMEPVTAAHLGHIAEDQWIGVHGGIMDQMVSMLSQPGHALFLDCRSSEFEQIPLPRGVMVAILDTGTRRDLVNSAYNDRRRECEEAARALGVRSLRDMDEAKFASLATRLDEVTRRRARHVITENRRVLEAVKAMREGDAVTLGSLLDASHASLRDDFEVSSAPLNTIVDDARQQPGCLGARLTGAGFAGCAIALVDQEKCPPFADKVKEKYFNITGKKPSIFLTRAARGAKTMCLTI